MFDFYIDILKRDYILITAGHLSEVRKIGDLFSRKKNPKQLDSFIVLRLKHEPLARATGQPCLTYDNKLD